MNDKWLPIIEETSLKSANTNEYLAQKRKLQETYHDTVAAINSYVSLSLSNNEYLIWNTKTNKNKKILLFDKEFFLRVFNYLIKSIR